MALRFSHHYHETVIARTPLCERTRGATAVGMGYTCGGCKHYKGRNKIGITWPDRQELSSFQSQRLGREASSSSFVSGMSNENGISKESLTEYRMRTMSSKTLTQIHHCVGRGKSQVEARRARLLASISIPMATSQSSSPKSAEPRSTFPRRPSP
jgi:hypothetical protein